MPFSHQQLPAAGIEGPSAPDLGKVGLAAQLLAGSPPAKQLDETYFVGIYMKKLRIDHDTDNHFLSFIVPETRMAKVGSLSARANFCHPET